MSEQSEVLIGSPLTSVEFVHDYIQLRFDGPTLTVNAPFRVLVRSGTFDKGATGFRDALCELIERVVRRSSTVPEQQFTIEFDDDSKLVVSLRPEDQVSPEAAILDQGSGQVCVWG